MLSENPGNPEKTDSKISIIDLFAQDNYRLDRIEKIVKSQLFLMPLKGNQRWEVPKKRCHDLGHFRFWPLVESPGLWPFDHIGIQNVVKSVFIKESWKNGKIMISQRAEFGCFW